MPSKNAANFEAWIRDEFKHLNSELEDLYFQQNERENVDGVGDHLKSTLVNAGNKHICALLKEGNTDEGFDRGFDLLGNVGFFMSACRRHGITDPAKETESPLHEASALAMQLGASLGVIPRFASAHLETHNKAINGQFKTFSNLDDEFLFLNYNTRGVMAYIRASECLLHALPLGISHPVTGHLLEATKRALQEVVQTNALLFKELDVDRFFYCVRPYYRPHYVGKNEYRGANAGDFAGINVIDLLLGLCRADDPYYSQILVDKFLYMRPEDQLTLRDCMRRRSLLDEFLDQRDTAHAEPWFQSNVKVFLEVCEMHGRTATQHHEMLVNKFIEKPADDGDLTERDDLTASGPPLHVLLKDLRRLCDLRNHANIDGIGSRFHDFETLRDTLL